MKGHNLYHPSREELVAFGLGKLEDDAHQEIEQHVVICRQCCLILQDLPSDTVVLLLRCAEDDTSASPDIAPQGAIAERSSSNESASEEEIPAGLRDHPRYRVTELLERGGMGDVYKAEHRVMQRPVAIKVINRNLVKNPTAIERFRREAQAAARLDHPNIVTAYEAGQDGELDLLVMEFVEGTNLAKVVHERGPLSVVDACNYIMQAAEGLQHACQAGMIHRDVKPQNLMLTADGKIKILDLGLAGLAVEAVLADDDDTEQPSTSGPSPESLTAHGSMMGTPDYVAPEQARDARVADTRADIYGLGCTFYFLLTGRAPFPDGSAADKVRAHQQQAPAPVRSLRSDIPPQVEAVLNKMMAKDPGARYQRPAEVVAALKPIVSRGPDHERFPAVTSRAWFNRRSVRILAAAGGVVLLGVVTWIASDRGRIEIRTEVDDVQVVVSREGQEVEVIDLRTGAAVRWLASDDYQVKLMGGRNDVKLSHDTITVTRWGKRIVKVTRVDAARREAAAPGAAEISADLSQPRDETFVVTQPLRELTGHTAIVRGLDISADGKMLVSASWDGSARLWNLQNGKLRRLFHHEPRVNDARFSRDGERVLVAHEETVKVYDAQTYECLPTKFQHPGLVSKMELSADGTRLLTGCADGNLRLWDVEAGSLIKNYLTDSKGVEAVLFTAGGEQVLSGGRDTRIQRFDASSGRQLAWYPHPGAVHSLCSSLPAGRVVYVGCADGVIRAWDFRTGQIVRQFRGHQGAVLRLVAARGRMLISASSDRTVRVWDVATGREIARLEDHEDRVDAVAISPDRRLIVTGGGFKPRSPNTWEKPDYAIRLWRIEPPAIEPPD